MFNLRISNVLLPIVFIFPGCWQTLKSDIKEIHSFNEVDFAAIKPDTLVIFDVDETLIQPVDAYVVNEQSKQAEAFRQKLVQKYPEVSDWTYIASIMLQQADRPLIDPTVIQKIDELKARNIPVIACTSMNTGPYGLLPSMEQWRYEHLKSLGFQGSFDDKIIAFDSFKRKPVFYKGILATDVEIKGPVIGAFLDKMNLHPKEIVMFDDSLDYLISVQEECKKRGIEFQGYQYKGAVEKPWDEMLFELQADYLIRNKKWLNDQETQSMQPASSPSYVSKQL